MSESSNLQKDVNNERPRKKKPPADQATGRLALLMEAQETILKHTNHMLKVLMEREDSQQIWERKECKLIRERIEMIKCQPIKYHLLSGDQCPEFCDANMSASSHSTSLTLTNKFIQSIANFQDVEDRPVLQIVSIKMDFEQSTKDKKSNSVHFTHARVCDGSQDVMVARFAMNLAHDGNRLDEGDVIRLSTFTPLQYRSGNSESQKSPAVIVHSFSKIGYASLPPKLNNPIHCVKLTEEEINEYNQHEIQSLQNGPSTEKSICGKKERLTEVDCCAGNRYCSVYGVNTIVCVCESDPVDKLDLKVVRQYCWFATMDAEKMPNRWKRNMLYWWYMSNVYQICGKGKRRDPPLCLKAAIRKAYPEEDGWYDVFVPGLK